MHYTPAKSLDLNIYFYYTTNESCTYCNFETTNVISALLLQTDTILQSEWPHLIWMCLKYEICLNLARRERERGLLNFSHLNDSLIFCPLWLQLVTVDLILLNFKDISTISPD